MTDPSAIVIALIGLVFLLWAHKVTAFIMGGLAWQRRNIPDRSIGLQERIFGSRAFTWFLRIVGALILLGAALSAFGLTGETGR